MTQNLTIYRSNDSDEKATVMVTNDMTPADVIPILRIQSHAERRNRFGLMAAPHAGGLCRWLADEVPFASLVINHDDKIFVQPNERIITIHLPDERSTQMTIDQHIPVHEIVLQCCRYFEIWPAKIWGAYIHARGEVLLLLPDLSVAEQAPHLQHIYLRQSLFPCVTSHELLAPLHVYLMQYRQMAICGEIGTVDSDVTVLKRYDWYNRKDARIHISNTTVQQEREFDMFINLKSFGELAFQVRFHSTDSSGIHHQDRIRTLIVSTKSISILDEEDTTMKGRAFSTIKSIGVKAFELRIFFKDGLEWYILNHRASEICVAIKSLMHTISLTPPVHEMRPECVPLEKVLQVPIPRTCPKPRVPAEALLSHTFDQITRSYHKLAIKSARNEIDEEYAANQTALQAQLHLLMEAAQNCQEIDHSLIRDSLNCIDALHRIDSPKGSTLPVMEKILTEMNRRVGGDTRERLALISNQATPPVSPVKQAKQHKTAVRRREETIPIPKIECADVPPLQPVELPHLYANASSPAQKPQLIQSPTKAEKHVEMNYGNTPTSCSPSVYHQLPMYGYQPGPFYQPQFVPQFPTAPGSPNTTKVEASPNIILNIGSDGSPSPRRISKRFRKNLSFEDSESDSSEPGRNQQDVITDLDALLDSMMRFKKNGKVGEKQVREMSRLAGELRTVCDPDDESANSLVSKLKHFIRNQMSGMEEQLLLQEIAGLVDEMGRRKRAELRRNTIQKRNRFRDLDADGSVYSPGQRKEPGLQEVLRNLHTSLTRVQVQTEDVLQQ